ncbi:cadherin repeat domain-containing protein [Colwellia hornerae]|uniref:Cadherin repeat domain-containing protein n=1 Tax=Colwellia hornerae TaxID=89402 RepID=A0A5C6Q5V5_9GAMM|nr:cadherin repeat domain-containing protein [Colwellia hornerae]TWX59500.1 cadherin repeat domain-containing protein [Colwellia hornerae]TWX62870.1 cadherin repeat domain-containing protein [Colwellia hornerae]TWX64192.1 cadherin repeat domain-containing protein [Colwellia hornerae]
MLTSFKKHILPLSLVLSSVALAGCGGSSKSNVAPIVTGESSPTIEENTTSVGTYSATDANGDVIVLSLTGNSSALFSITQSGELSFIDAPDFDNGEVGPFAVTIVATDDGKKNLTGELAIQVSVGDVKDTPSFAVVQTVAPDFSGSEVVTLDPITEQVTEGYYIKDASDYTVRSYNKDVFHIGRYNIDAISKYNADALDTEVWSYTTQDTGDSNTRNPYDLVSVSESKAYLLRYGSDKVWIVNPQATQFEDFKLGELNLASYIADNNSNGTPNPASATIADGKLFIAMQRLSDSFSPNTAYVAVFDTATDEEIETNADADDNLKGIPLQGLNPLSHSIVSQGDTVYVTTRNSYSSSELALSRIEAIATSDYNLSSVLSAADIENNTGAFIGSSVVVSKTKGYFVASETFFTPSYYELSTVYTFNPTTGVIANEKIADTGTEQISYIALDAANFLWLSVSNPENPGVDVINTETNLKALPRLATELNPSAIAFIE